MIWSTGVTACICGLIANFILVYVRYHRPMKRLGYLITASLIGGLVLSSCGSTPAPISERAGERSVNRNINPNIESNIERSQNARLYTPAPSGTLALPDRAAFLQKDKRWGHHTLGGSGERLSSHGCVVTSAAIALANLGFETDPADLNARLKANGGFNDRGWFVWDSIRKVTGGAAYAKYFDTVNADIIDSCLADGAYPLTRFILPNGRTHWAVVIARDARGYHMRDPLRESNTPLIFPRGAEAFKSVRCIGAKRA